VVGAKLHSVKPWFLAVSIRATDRLTGVCRAEITNIRRDMLDPANPPCDARRAVDGRRTPRRIHLNSVAYEIRREASSVRVRHVARRQPAKPPASGARVHR
jgi:hypothetical protein